jgi:hypothetical protein
LCYIDDLKHLQPRKKYFVATQDVDLRRDLSHIPGIPLIYLNKVTLVLEPISRSSLEHNQRIETAKTVLTDEELNILKSANRYFSIVFCCSSAEYLFFK